MKMGTSKETWRKKDFSGTFVCVSKYECRSRLDPNGSGKIRIFKSIWTGNS